MIEINIKPFDTVFFRDGKPFNKGQQTYANTSFSLAPSIFYGAIASAYIAQNGGVKSLSKGRLFDVIKNAKENIYGSFKIKGVFILSSDRLLFPAPLNIIGNTDKKISDLSILLPSKNKYFTSFDDKVYLLDYPYVETEKKPLNNYVIADENLNKCLNGQRVKANYLHLKTSYFELEPKVGISIDKKTFASQEGVLYRANYYRLKEGVSFSVIAEGIKLQENGFLKLGGRDKTASYKIKEIKFCDKFLSKEKFSEYVDKSKNFILYLATPAIFENGWLIDKFRMEKDKYVYKSSSFEVSLIATAIGKSRVISGWDMVKKAPKPGYKVVPEGSVYFLKLEKGNSKDVFEEFNCKNLGIRKEEGFGLSLLGVYDRE